MPESINLDDCSLKSSNIYPIIKKILILSWFSCIDISEFMIFEYDSIFFL